MKKIKYLAIFILMITNIIILSTKVEATTGKVKAETVRVREEATTKSAILTQLDKGKEVEILEESEGWYKITVTENGKKITGYISAELLEVEDKKEENNNETPTQEPNNEQPQEQQPEQNNEQQPENEPTVETSANIIENTEYTISQEIKIRALPLINSRERATISTGNVKIVETINDWCKIENETETGWIRLNTLKKSIKSGDETTENQPSEQEKPNETVETNAPTTNTEKKPTSTTVIKTGYVSTDSLKVRKEASTSSEVIDSLKKNDQVSIIEELDGWYKIKLSDKEGYVSSKYISDKKVAETTSRGSSTSRTEQVTQVESEQQVEQPTTPQATTVSGEAVVEYAKQYLGYKYVSGGTSPSTGFDCSGFTQYVYKHFGITINRVSKDQNKNGVAVAKSNLQPGDLLIFNGESNKSIGHVGIYIGSGSFIHASNPKGGVKIDSISSSYYSVRYVGARRVI